MKFKEVKRLLNLFSYEDELFCHGFEDIAGVDEAGRGSLAGPIVASAVILDRSRMLIDRLNDSKKITPQNRNKIFRQIVKNCKCWSVAKVPPAIIDRLSIQKANILVMKKAVSRLRKKPDLVITDALSIDLKRFKIQSIPLINGDELCASISAASIIAKVIRDRLMLKYSRLYPEYDFAHNKGYGTKKHFLVLKKYGPCRIHRVSFRGVLI